MHDPRIVGGGRLGSTIGHRPDDELDRQPPAIPWIIGLRRAPRAPGDAVRGRYHRRLTARCMDWEYPRLSSVVHAARCISRTSTG
jgi:hypothetical protein